MSGYGVWNAIRELSRQRYGQRVPLYPTDHDDYFTDELNIEDVKFIVWSTIGAMARDREMFYSPMSQMVEKVAEIAYDVLEQEYERAPESTRTAKTINDLLASDDIFKLRDLAKWLLIDCPLTRAWNVEEKLLQAAASMQEKLEIDPQNALYTVIVNLTWSTRLYPLGQEAQKILASMARQRGMEEAAKSLDELVTRPSQEYEVVSHDDKYIYVRDREGEELRIITDSIKKAEDIIKASCIVAALVWHGGGWNVNGLCSGLPTKPEDKEERVDSKSNKEATKELVEKIMRRHRGTPRVLLRQHRRLQGMVEGHLGPQGQKKRLGRAGTIPRHERDRVPGPGKTDRNRL